MKKLSLLFVVLLLGIQGFSQFTKFVDSSHLEILPLDSATGKIDFQGVVKVDSLSKQEIFDRALKWVSGFSSTGWLKNESADFEAGKIRGRGIFTGVAKDFGKIDFTISFDVEITVKEGRYRYEMTNFFVRTSLSSPSDMTDWYNDPKHKKRSGEFKGGTSAAFVQTTSVAGQLFSKSLVEQIASNALKSSNANDKDNF